MDNTPNEKPKRQRSRMYPSHDLQTSLESSYKIYKSIGMHPASADVIAKNLGYNGKNGTSSTLISSLAQYGLLKKSGKGSYAISEDALKALMPKDDEEKQQTITLLAKNPALYFEILEEFSGEALPPMFVNRLTREFGLTNKVSEEAANIFKNTMEFANLLRNDILYDTSENESLNSGSASLEPANDLEDDLCCSENPDNNHVSKSEDNLCSNHENNIHYEITLKATLKDFTEVKISFPKSPNPSDIQQVIKYLNYFKETLEED